MYTELSQRLTSTGDHHLLLGEINLATLYALDVPQCMLHVVNTLREQEGIDRSAWYGTA
jgi:hypothetical protein